MARIAGIDIPRNKRGVIALTYIYGIGRSRAAKVLADAGVDENKKVDTWTDDEVGAIRNAIATGFKVEGELRSEVSQDIKRLMDIGCQRGIRHRRPAPPRSAHQEQLPHPEGQAEDGRKQEEVIQRHCP